VPVNIEDIKKFILEHPDLHIPKIMKHFQCSMKNVAQARKELGIGPRPPKEKRVRMGRPRQTTFVKKWLEKHPNASIKETIEGTKTSKRTVERARIELMEDGLLTPSRRAILDGEPDYSNQTLDTQTLQNIAKTITSDESNEIIEAAEDYDEETRLKMLKEVKNIALNSGAHPDTRLSAIQIWAKLKDIAKAKDIGPGPPRNEQEIIDRLSRIMVGVGPTLTIKALDFAFKKEKPDANEQIAPVNGTSEALSTI